MIAARGRCTSEADNLLGASNDLAASRLPSATGAVLPIAESAPAWEVPLGGCRATVDPETGFEVTTGCVEVSEILDVDARGHAVPGVPGRNAAPRAFRVVFAPGSDVSGATVDFTGEAAWAQTVALPAGVYRLSWYASSSADIPGRDAIRLSASETPTVFETLASSAALPSAGWSRYFRFFEVTADGTVVAPGIYPSPTDPVAPQSAEVAGVFLEDVTATVGLRSWASLDQLVVDLEPGIYYPPPFVATSQPAVGSFDDCRVSDPAAFTDAWRYRCEALCGGGFGADHCTDGETPEDFCFWEYSFALTEEQLLARDGGFGGGLRVR